METVNETNLKIEPQRIYDRYEVLAERVATEEARILPQLPLAEPQGLDDIVRGCITNWKDKRKSLRTVAVLNAIDHAVDGDLPDACVDVLVSLDALINVLDDIIDDASPSKPAKIGYTVNAAFATTSLYSNLSDSVQKHASKTLFEYFTKLFQIPKVESSLLARMQGKTSPAERVATATEIYEYRALDMEAFVEIALQIYTDSANSALDQSVRAALHEDLVTYRARCLLFKDVYDIERDYRDDDVTPVLARVKSTRDPAVVEQFITGIANQFSYSADSRDSYRDALLHLERRPDSMAEEIAGQIDSLRGL